MFRQRIPKIIAFLLLLLVTAACGQDEAEDLETPTVDSATIESEQPVEAESPPVEPVTGETTGAIVGTIDNATGPLPDNIYIWTVKLLRSPEGYGIFALNTLTTPSFLVETSGEFQTEPIEAGEYVLIVGNSPESAAAILREDGQAQPFEILAGEILDIGKQTIALALPPALEDRPTPGYPPPQPTQTPYYP